MTRPDVWLVRHGQTEWSASGRHTSVTDLPLLPAGEAAARRLAPLLTRHRFALVMTSPMKRARATAALAGFPGAMVDDDLCEWNYGDLEGMTSAQIHAQGGAFANWRIWTGPVPGGETAAQVEARACRLLARADAAEGDVLFFGHGHALRVFTAVALELDPRDGARFTLDTATINVVGTENGLRALSRWNVRE
jgi:probable phosphoglycerate mutase